MLPPEQRARVRALNDALRQGFSGGRLQLTQGLLALPNGALVEAMTTLATFEDFSPGDDPYGEHDFGAFHVAGRQLFSRSATTPRASKRPLPIPATRRCACACSPSCCGGILGCARSGRATWTAYAVSTLSSTVWSWWARRSAAGSSERCSGSSPTAWARRRS